MTRGQWVAWAIAVALMATGGILLWLGSSWGLRVLMAAGGVALVVGFLTGLTLSQVVIATKTGAGPQTWAAYADSIRDTKKERR